MNALDYFLKANLYGLLFVGCYWLFLRRHTFFSLNRVYLLASAVLALVLPLASLPTQTVETIETLPGLDWSGLDIPVGVITLPTVVSTPIVPVETGPDWEQIGLIAYGLIALALLFHLAIRTGRLIWLIRKSPRQVRDGYVLVQPNDPTIPTFSFFHYLVLNPADTHNSLIIKHELIHIRQSHSGDVLGLAVLRAIFWLCPTLWLTDRLLRQVHEFLADKSSSQPSAYARFLIEYTFGVKPDALTNGFFNPSLLKQRILMLHQKATTRWALGKYALVLPLALGLLAMTTAREEIAAVVSQATDETITVSGRVTGADGKPLAGVNVVVATTGKGTPTDQHGFYKLANVPVTATLAYSHVGYQTDLLHLETLNQRAKNNLLTLNSKLTPNLQDELPAMGATAAYKAIKPNPAMPVRTPPSSQTINGEVFTAVEEPAVFPTGIPGLMQYVAHALRYPVKAKTAGIQGSVFVQFVVLPTGAIGSATIKKGIGSGCDEEALRVVRQMPKWIPAQQNGKSVASQYVVPIQFALEKNEDKRTGQQSRVQPDSAQKMNFAIIDNSKNGRFALYNDVKQKAFARLDSNPVVQPDSGKRPSMRLRAFPVQQTQPNNSTMRYSSPGMGLKTISSPGRNLPIPGEKAELFLINGTKQVDTIGNFKPSDIESIEVHKDPETIAKYKVLYGEKAAKGVVIINLKSANTL